MTNINKLENVIEFIRILDTRLSRLDFYFEDLSKEQIREEIKRIRKLINE